MKKQGEEGFVLVVSLVLLIILALFGMFATRMATTEYQIAGNERVYVENFYGTESAVMELAHEIYNEDSTDAMVSKSDIPGYDSSDKGAIGEYLKDKGKKKGDNVRVLAVNRGDKSCGGSITMRPGKGSKRMREIDIFAQSTQNGTDKIIKIGLKQEY